MINNAQFPYTYQSKHGRFTVYRHDDLKQSMVTVGFPHDSCTVTMWITDEELRTLSTMLTDCLDTSKPLFSEVA
jgi:hypothetical protein